MNKKRFLPLILILALFITIGFAALRTNLQINGTANFKGNNWDIHFENVNITEGSVTATTVPTSDNTTTTEITYEVNLEQPGEFYEFTVDAVNKGSIDAMVETTPTLTLSDTTLSNVLLSSITYDDGVAIEQYDLLAATKSLKYKVRVEYKRDLQNSELISTDKSVTITFTVSYVQADSNAKEKKIWRAITGDGTNIGDEIAIGDEHFYVISNDGTTINALAKYNLHAGNMCTAYGSCIPIVNPTYKQDETMTGIIDNNGLWSYGHGSLAFSNTYGWPNRNNETIDIQTYDGPVKTAINAYKEILPEGVDVRLITKAEVELLVNDGAPLGSNSIKSKADAKGVSWIYSTSYWSGSADALNDGGVWEMSTSGGFGTSIFSGFDHNGVRPVISLEI